MRWLPWALLLVVGCQCGAPSDRKPLVVFAASSLTDAFGEIERDFERAHPRTDVVLVFAGSQALRLQIEQGAPADVVASANPRHMAALKGRVRDVREFAKNALTVAVPEAAPEVEFEALPRLERIVVGAPEVPIGAYTEALFAEARRRFGDDFADRLQARVVSREANVRLVLSKVELGEADAAVVYRTDVLRASGVRAVPIPAGLAPAATYLVGRIVGGREPEAAHRFVEFLGEPAGVEILRRHGFDVTPRAP